jgi:hypothetical protein
MAQQVFKARHGAEISAAVERTNLECTVSEIVVQKGKKRARRVVVDAPDTAMAMLRMTLSDASPIGGWKAL